MRNHAVPPTHPLILACGAALLCLQACAVSAADLPADFKLRTAAGQSLDRQSERLPPAAPAIARILSPGKPVIATTYFYWYDVKTKAHIIDGDGSDALTDHPPTLAGFSYTNVDWHRRQLADMTDAGIDVVLPVYWGMPLPSRTWSDVGIPPLIVARRKLLASGATPPAIGMFYDTSTMQHNEGGYHVDLTDAAGCGSTARSATFSG